VGLIRNKGGIMIRKSGFAALALVIAASMATAGGGKIKWADCKSDKDFDRLSAECKMYGQAMMVYFTSDS